MNIFKKILTAATLAVMLSSGSAVAFQSAPKKATTAKKPSPVSSLSVREIADSRAKDMVWVNTNTKVYYRNGEFYGKTKPGKFMTETDAIKSGARPPKPAGGIKNTPPKK